MPDLRNHDKKAFRQGAGAVVKRLVAPAGLGNNLRPGVVSAACLAQNAGQQLGLVSPHFVSLFSWYRALLDDPRAFVVSA